MNSLPKRRKYKDNPYTLNTIDNHYYILFRDGQNIPRIIEVKKEVYDIFNQFELDDLKEINENSSSRNWLCRIISSYITKC